MDKVVLNNTSCARHSAFVLLYLQTKCLGVGLPRVKGSESLIIANILHRAYTNFLSSSNIHLSLSTTSPASAFSDFWIFTILLVINPNFLVWLKVGLAAYLSKANKEAKFIGGKIALFWMPGMGGADTCPRADCPPAPTVRGKSFYRQSWGLHTDRAPSALSSWHWSSVVWAASSCFRYSYSSVPESVCFHFLRPVLGIVATYVMARVRSSCS